MNKVVPTVLAMSVTFLAAGCSSSGSNHTSHSGVKVSNASYTAERECSNCGAGYHSAGHAHTNHSGAAIRHTHVGGAGHAHSGYSAGYGYTSNASVSAGRNTMIRTSGQGAAASGGTGVSTAVKVAGALLVGGLLYHAISDDDDDNKTTTTTPTTPATPCDPKKMAC
jgi:hypothetical protein